MSSRIKKTASILLSASIIFSYGINLVADDESIDTDETVLTETEETGPETDEEIIEVEDPEAAKSPFSQSYTISLKR